MSPDGLKDDPALLRVPRQFTEEVEERDLGDEDLAPLVARLPKFCRTFFQTFFDEELGIEITGVGDDERRLASNLAVDFEDDEERADLVPLLEVFVDFCDLYIETEELSTPEEAGEHQEEILILTAQLLDQLSLWARYSGRPVLGGMAGDLGKAIGHLA